MKRITFVISLVLILSCAPAWAMGDLRTNFGVGKLDSGRALVHTFMANTLSISYSSGAYLPLGSETYDPNSCQAGGTFTAPIAGDYLFELVLENNSANGGHDLYVQTAKNGTAAFAQEIVSMSGYGYTHYAIKLTLAAGDTISFRIACNIGSGIIIGLQSKLSVSRY